MEEKEKKEEKKVENKELISRDETLEFFIGMCLLGAGLYMLSKKVIVNSSWYTCRIGTFDLSSGTVIIPFIIGVIWLILNPKSKIPKWIITLSIVFIILTIIMSVRLYFMPTSLFDYVLIFALVAAGAGLLLKVLFVNKE